jgi:putative RNA 2'-phosphotransferase
MTDNRLKQRSIKLAWLLRHGARETGLAMDAAGFAPLVDVLRHTGLSPAELDTVVAENNKARFEVRGALIRAVQGHSTEGTPVTLDGLEASWQRVDDDDALFHGTSVDAARAILSGAGVHAAARTHVHLAAAENAVVGKRFAVAVLLVVDPPKLRAAGGALFRAQNGVILTRAVPRAAVVDVKAQTRAGHAALAELLGLLRA